MAFYVFIAICIFLVVCVSQNLHVGSKTTVDGEIYYPKNSQFAKVSFILFMIFFCILTGWRSSSIGNDTNAYIDFFKYYSTHAFSFLGNLEFGYRFYCYFVGLFTKNPHVFLIITAVVCYTTAGVAVYRNSKDLGFSLCLFFCIFFSAFTNTLRQSIALSIGVFVYFAIKKKHFVRAVLLIALALLFHKSAVVLLALLFYRLIPTKPKFVLPILAATIVLSMAGALSKLIVFVLPQYRYYVESDFLSDGWLAVFYYLARNLVFYFLVYAAYKKSEIPGKQLILSVFSVLLWMTGLGFAVNLFTRASEYLLVIVVIELPNAFCCGKLKNKSLYIYLISIVMLAYFIVVLAIRPEWNHLCPYRFWQEM